MVSVKKGFLFLLLFISLSGASALDYGFKLNWGISSGSGQNWNAILDEAGNRDFNDALPTLGLGGFIDFPIAGELYITPELYYVLNRGVHLSNARDDYLKASALHSLEMILPIARDFPFSSDTKALRVMGGFQLQYSFDITSRSQTDNIKTETTSSNTAPLSVGFVLGTGVEFRRQKKMSWMTDLRMKIPFSNSMGYTVADGSDVKVKTLEILMGAGIKF